MDSTHSSPRSYANDLYPLYTPHPHHSHTYPIPSYPHRPPHKSSIPPAISLSVSTSTAASEHDPNEKTARPGNAHQHGLFLSGALTSSHSTDDSRSLLFPDPDPASSDDPGATPVVTHPPNTDSSLSAPENSTPPPPPAATSTIDEDDYSALASTTPGLSRGLSRPLTPQEQERLAHLDRLKFFLATAPSQWDNARPTQSFAPTSGSNAYPSPSSVPMPSSVGSSTGWGMGLPSSNPNAPQATAGPGADAYSQGMHPSLNRFMLPSQEFVTCVLWNGLYHITGTDIVRALVFRFEAFGRPVRNMKKFEEGVFSDLRNLKPGVDACLEEPKSPFLDLLFKYQCIRTQKKQKVFYWFSVPHDRLFLDALERDLKREKMGQEPTTHVVGEPALSFTYDPKRSLYEQFAKGAAAAAAAALKDGGESEDQGDVSESDTDSLVGVTGMDNLHIDTDGDSEMSDAEDLNDEEREKRKRIRQEQQRKRHPTPATFFSNLFGLFEGSPTYKQRRKKNPSSIATGSTGGLGGGGGSALSRSVSSSSSASSMAYRRASEDFGVERGRPSSMGSYGSGLVERHHHQSASVSRERPYPYPPPYSHIQRHPHSHHHQPHHSHGHSHGHSHSLSSATPFQPYSSMQEEFGPGSLDAIHHAELDAAEMFQLQARRELMPADGVVRKVKVQHVLPEVPVMISEGFTAHQVQQPGGVGGAEQQHQQHHLHQVEDQLDPTGYSIDATSATNNLNHHHQQPSPPDTTSTTTTSTSSSSSAQQQPYETNTSTSTISGVDGKVRAFMCPLYSCGRLFRRMEHLKRHLRTHTMERPYSCPVCQKRFSRSDNLNQHLRTHERGGGVVGAAGSSGPGTGTGAGGFGNTNGGGLDGLGGGTTMDIGMTSSSTGGMMDFGGGDLNDLTRMTTATAAAAAMWRDASEDSGDLSGTESEGGFDEGAFMYHHHQQQQQQQQGLMGGLYTMGGGGGLSHPSMLGLTGLGGLGGGLVGGDIGMCEIEVQAGDVSEIPGAGEEDGMLLRTHAQAQFVTNLPSTSQLPPPPPPTGTGTATTTTTAPQWVANHPNHHHHHHHHHHHPHHQHRQSTGSIYGTTNGVDDYTTTTTTANTNANTNAGAAVAVAASMSAPSHKQVFDHAAMYPPGLLDSSTSTSSNNGSIVPPGTPSLVNVNVNSTMGGGGGGPIRRHRSMTPSIIGRSIGESIRRPMSTASNGSNGGGGGGGVGGEGGSGSSSPGPMQGMMNMSGGNGSMTGVGVVGMGGPTGGTGARGYHPYGYTNAAGNSRSSGSTHSSPAVYNVPLGSANSGGDPMMQQQQLHTPPQPPNTQLRRSDSRTGFIVDDPHQHGHGMFRTESPGSFIPRQQQQAQQQYGGGEQQHSMFHANTMPVGVYDQTSMHQQQQQQVESEGQVSVVDGGGYYPQTHATL